MRYKPSVQMERKNVDTEKYVTKLRLFEVCFFFFFSCFSPWSLSLLALLHSLEALCQEVTLQLLVDINVGVQKDLEALNTLLYV